MQLMGALGYLWIDLIVYAVIIFLLLLPKNRFKHVKLHHLLILVVVARLAYYAYKVISGHVLYDYDTTYYHTYGRELLSGKYPIMEYPTGALLLFFLLSITTAKIELFRLLFPLLQLPASILIVTLFYKLGKHYQNTYPAILASILFALSPSMNWFWFYRYDEFVILIILAGLYAFITNRPGQGTFWETLGFTIKWVPLLTLPAYGIHWLKTRNWHTILKTSTIFLFTVIIISAPFFIANQEKFLHTYETQENRTLNGESLYNAIEGNHDIQPYGYPNKTIFTSTTINIITAIIALGWLLLLYYKTNKRTVHAFAALSIILFVIVNKIHSTQYVVWTIPLFALILLSLPKQDKRARVMIFLLLFLDLANFLKSPITPPHWLLYSRIYWALTVGCFAYLLSEVMTSTRSRDRKSRHPNARMSH